MLGTLEPPREIRWSALRAELRAVYERSLTPIVLPGAVKLADVVRTVSQMLPEDGIVTNGAGNYAGFRAPLLRVQALPHAARADVGLHGLRSAGGDRCQAGRAQRGRS